MKSSPAQDPETAKPNRELAKRQEMFLFSQTISYFWSFL